MHKYVSINGHIAYAEDAFISTLSSAALFGKGIFTTVAIYDGKPFLWEKHWLRLETNAEKLKIDLADFSENATIQSLDELIQTNKVTNGRARISFLDESPSPIWSNDGEGKTTLSIIVAQRRPVPDPFRLTVSPYRVNSLSPLVGVKSCNYLEHLMALDEAKARVFDEAIRVNERGYVTSGCMANVFWLKDDILYTPSLKTGCLPGTTREFVLENVECREVEATLDELYIAGAIFLTSAGLGIAAVNECNGRKLTVGEFPITKLLS